MVHFPASQLTRGFIDWRLADSAKTSMLSMPEDGSCRELELQIIYEFKQIEATSKAGRPPHRSTR
jgi:hypothetical protein